MLRTRKQHVSKHRPATWTGDLGLGFSFPFTRSAFPFTIHQGRGRIFRPDMLASPARPSDEVGSQSPRSQSDSVATASEMGVRWWLGTTEAAEAPNVML